jgi:hypothetical protein
VNITDDPLPWTDQNPQVIKAINPRSLETTHAVTVVDRGVLELKTAIASLEAQIEGLQKQIS